MPNITIYVDDEVYTRFVGLDKKLKEKVKKKAREFFILELTKRDETWK